MRGECPARPTIWKLFVSPNQPRHAKANLQRCLRLELGLRTHKKKGAGSQRGSRAGNVCKELCISGQGGVWRGKEEPFTAGRDAYISGSQLYPPLKPLLRPGRRPTCVKPPKLGASRHPRPKGPGGAVALGPRQMSSAAAGRRVPLWS